MSTQSRSLRIATELTRAPFAFPGGYPRYAITSDGGCLCHGCCKTERESIGTTTGSDGWNVIALEVNFEDEMHCDNCGEEIVAVYR